SVRGIEAEPITSAKALLGLSGLMKAGFGFLFVFAFAFFGAFAFEDVAFLEVAFLEVAFFAEVFFEVAFFETFLDAFLDAFFAFLAMVPSPIRKLIVNSYGLHTR